MAVTTRLRDAMNAHDLEALLDCFHEDYRSEQPVHPGRGFGGRHQVRANWSAIFCAVDGSALETAGVIIVGVRDDRIAWGRLYIEPVQVAEETIDEAVQRMAGRRSD